MLISKETNEALNQQIGNEFLASLQYVAIAAHFDRESLPELAAHFYRQSDEERAHAMRMVKFLVDAGGSVQIPPIAGPRAGFGSPEEAVRIALDHELDVTHQINRLVDLAQKQNDHITQAFLQWFVTEQLEEVSSTDTLLRIIQRAGDNILHVEEYLARRNPVQNAAATAGP